VTARLPLPTVAELATTVLACIKAHDGMATIQEIEECVAERLRLTKAQCAIPHKGREKRSELDYRLAWARTKLRAAGLIRNEGRGIWAVAKQHTDQMSS